jgi:hypothetical protein
MADVKPPDQAVPDRVLEDQPAFRPLERFWPYADLPEQPTDDELARVHPELREVLFGTPPLPFSLSLVFSEFGGENFPRALALARASDEYTEFTEDGVRRHRARFFPADRPLRVRDLYELVSAVPGTEVLVDDKPVPYARELWLPLVWFLIR